MPHGHCHVLYFLKINSMLFTMAKTIFKSEDQGTSYMFFEYGGTTIGTFGKTCFEC